MLYKKKPVIVDAVQWNPGSGEALPSWFVICVILIRTIRLLPDGCLEIGTLEGNMIAQPGDYIIRGVDGEVYACKPSIFERTYERVV